MSRRRPTSNTAIARGLGGRSGLSGGESAGETPEEATSKTERVASARNGKHAIAHFEDYDDQNRLRPGRLLPRADPLTCASSRTGQ